MTRVVLTLSLLAVAMSSVGCSTMAREEYSIIIRKRAHRYEPPMPQEPPRETWTLADEKLDPWLAPFRPFTYCHRHRSRHVSESFAAIAAAPVELPLVFTAHTTGEFGKGVHAWFSELLGLSTPEEPAAKGLPPPPSR